MRLSNATLGALPGAVARPAYDRAALAMGVLHFGPGAFFRVHQAFVFDRLGETDPRWGVCAVSLKSPDVAEALSPQDGLYTLAELGPETKLRVIGALKQVLVGPVDPEAVFARFTDPALRIVSLTVTEKGYCLGSDRALDFSHPDVAADLADPARPVSVIGWLVEGLRRRRAADLPPPVVLSCDNLPDNGALLKAAVVALARRRDPGLADWIGTAAFPRTMVDSITPATDDALRAQVALGLGQLDAWPVQREPFVQWVIEQHADDAPPDWAAAGVEITPDVRPWEAAKLRLLNGPHSSLAYIGLLRGHDTVAQAMADAELAAFVERLMAQDIAPSLGPGGPPTGAYIAAILERFRNPGIAHALSQIAWDGSQKLPIRLLGTLADAIAAGRPVDRLCLPLAAWMRFVVERTRAGVPIVDPLAASLAAIAMQAGDAEAMIGRFLALEAVFPQALAEAAAVRAALVESWRRLDDPTGALTP